MTEMFLSIMPFNGGMWGAVYSNIIFYSSHTLCSFDWYSPESSQCKYLTGFPYDVFSKYSFIFFGILYFVFVKKLQYQRM